MSTKEFRMCLPPFQEWYSSGPFYDKNNDRMLIHLLRKGSPARTLSYPRYLYSVNVGEEPSAEFEVDHIDGNRRNDRIDNLQLLSAESNKRKAIEDPRPKSLQDRVQLVCPKCRTTFIRRKSSTIASRKQVVPVTFCSRVCRASWREFLNCTQDIVYLEKAPVPTKAYMEPWALWSSELYEQDKVTRANKAIRTKMGGYTKICSGCGTTFVSKNSKQVFCGAKCSSSATGRALSRFSKEQAEPLVLAVLNGESSWSKAGKDLGVSDNAIKKWAIRNGYPVKIREYKRVPGAGVEPATP